MSKYAKSSCRTLQKATHRFVAKMHKGGHEKTGAPKVNIITTHHNGCGNIASMNNKASNNADNDTFLTNISYVMMIVGLIGTVTAAIVMVSSGLQLGYVLSLIVNMLALTIGTLYVLTNR